MIFYESNGNFYFKKDYKNNKLNDEVIQYNNNKVVAKSSYKNGKQVGKTIWY